MTSSGPPTPPIHEAAQRRDWVAYFDRIEGKPPRETLVYALDRFDRDPSADSRSSRHAIDLGCGSGRDAAELLERGWRVTALDGHADGIRRTLERPACVAHADRLDARVASFEGLDLPPCDLLNASFSLPFCPPDHFVPLWATIVGSITPGGRFAGQFFGDRDSWATIEDRTHLTRGTTLALFEGFILERFEEEDRPSADDSGGHKHWHVFHVVARKRGGETG